MKLSIVTISFNQGPFLERAIRSVVDQAGIDLEYIVVDPGSSDGSRDIIARYRDRISVFVDSPDRGPSDGLNKGFAHATGDIFGYINADDAFLPGALAEVAAAFEKYPAADVISGHGYVIDGAGRAVYRVRSNRYDPWRFAYGGVFIMQQSTFFRAGAFRRAGGFNPENRTCWDGELMVDLGRAGARFRVVDRAWSLFTVHENSITGTGRLNETFWKDNARLAEKALGRRLPARVGVRRLVARLLKYADDPRAIGQKLCDRAFGCPALPRAPHP